MEDSKTPLVVATPAVKPAVVSTPVVKPVVAANPTEPKKDVCPECGSEDLKIYPKYKSCNKCDKNFEDQ